MCHRAVNSSPAPLIMSHVLTKICIWRPKCMVRVFGLLMLHRNFITFRRRIQHIWQDNLYKIWQIRCNIIPNHVCCGRVACHLDHMPEYTICVFRLITMLHHNFITLFQCIQYILTIQFESNPLGRVSSERQWSPSPPPSTPPLIYHYPVTAVIR